MATRIQNRRDTAANWTANDPTLSDGEIGFETDTGLFKIGKNNTSWTSLEYSQNSPPGFELDAKIQNFDPNTYPQDDDVTDYSDMEIGDVLVLDADTAKAVFKIGDRVRANSVSQREYVFSDLSSSLFNSETASVRTELYNEQTQQYDVTPGDTFTFTTTNPNLAIKVGSYLSLYRNTNPIFGAIYVEVKSISSDRLTYTCELTYIDRTSIFNEETQVWVPQEFTATSWNGLFSLGGYPNYHYPSYPQLSGVFDEGDSLAGVIANAYLEGIVTGLNANSASITIDNLGPSGPPIWFENMKIFPAPGRDGDDGLSYDIYPTVSLSGSLPPSNDSISMLNSSVGASYYVIGADTLFKAGDWIKLVYIDRSGSIGTANTVYPDVFVEGYILRVLKYPESNYNEYEFIATKINGGSQEGNNINEWTTGLLPEPKATYEFPAFIYPVGDPNAGVRTAPPPKPSSVGEEYPIEGQPGLYQVGQKIRMQSLDEFGVALPEDYAVFEIIGIQKYIQGVQTDGLNVRCLEVYVDFNSIPYSYSFSLHASDGAQGPGYEVTYDSNVHMLPDDVSTVWASIDQNKTSWAAGDLYTIPGNFSNSAYKIGSYVKYYFGAPAYSDTPYIEGWIRDISEIGGYAQIIIQRWSNNSNWSFALPQLTPIVPIFPAHFEPGYNFDKMINISGGYTERAPDQYDYLSFTDAMSFDYPSMDFYGYHRGSYNPGDYVVISSRSNPGIKVLAYIGSIGYSDVSLGEFYIYPLEILAWDASEEDTFTDWTLSIASPPKKEYKLSKPLPLPWNAINPSPEPYPLAIPFSLPELLDIVGISGDPGLFKVGNLVRAVSKSEPTAAFYGEITELGSASNNFTTFVEVSDVSEWTEDQLNEYSDWELSLGQKPEPVELFVKGTSYIESYSSTITVSLPEKYVSQYKIGDALRVFTSSSDGVLYDLEGIFDSVSSTSGVAPNITKNILIRVLRNSNTFTESYTGEVFVSHLVNSSIPETKNLNAGGANIENISITAEDIGKFVYSYSSDPVTVTMDVSPNMVPWGSQVTVIQRWSGPVTISPSSTSGPIYFAETDGLTEGTVTLKGIYSAATIVNAEGWWVAIGSFGSADPAGGGGGG